MKNRLRFFGQSILLLGFLFSLPQTSSAQCPDTTGVGANFFTTLFAPYTMESTVIAVDANTCMGVFQKPNIGIDPYSGYTVANFDSNNPTSIVSSNAGVYAFGDFVPGGVNLEITYLVTIQNVATMIMNSKNICVRLSFEDHSPPVFTDAIPGDITVSCPADVPPGTTLNGTDGCDGAFSASSSDNIVFGVNDCLPLDQVITRTWTQTDVAGNTTTETQLITVLANKPPTLGITLTDTNVTCEMADFTGWLGQIRTDVMANVMDDCGMASVVDDYGTVPIAATDTICGSVTVTWTLTDICGLQSQFSTSYITTDDTAPILFGVPADQTISCEVPVPAAPTVSASDNCDPNTIIVGMQEVIISDPNCAFQDTIRRTWAAVDACGNPVAGVSDILQVDVSAPTYVAGFTPPLDTVVNCDAVQDTMFLGNIAPEDVEDNCDMNLTIVFTELPGTAMDCPSDSTYTRRWEVTDACGNTLTHEQIITVQDTLQPVITFFPQDTVLDCSASTDPSSTGQLTATDNCTMPPVVQYTDNISANGDVITRDWMIMDGCNMSVGYTQTITIIDTIAPVIIGGFDIQTACGLTSDMATLFNQWVSLNAGADATDNCPDPDMITWMAFYSGTTTVADSASYVTILNSVTCPTPTMGIFEAVSVDFIAFDEAGNSDTLTQNFTIADNSPPVLSNCPADITVDTDNGVCEAILTLEVPMIEEDCNNAVQNQVASDGAPIVSDNPGDLETPVNPVSLFFSVNPPPFSASSDATLEIALINSDIEQIGEFFNIIGEDGTVLGQTLNTSGNLQCTDTTTIVTVTMSQYNDWAADGVIEITLDPNIPAGLPGRFAINDICGGSNVVGTLNYEVKQPEGIVFEYSLNGGARMTMAVIAPFDRTFDQGTTLVTYFVTDCTGNEATCSFNVTVEDNEAPVIVCPVDMTLDVDAGLCERTMEIPLFTSVTDNCAVTTPITVEANNNADSLLTFELNPNLGVQNAQNVVINFPTPLQANATPGSVQLIIELQGDFDNGAEEFFEIFDQDNNLLGTTGIAGADCNTPGSVTFNIDAQVFNNWANAGPVFFTAISNLNINPPGTADSGINPCDDLDVNGQDSISYLTAVLQYESVSPDFTINGSTTTLTPPLVPQMATLTPGVNTVTYAIEDLADNPSSCSFDITIEDNELPTAVCVPPLFVNINPSGFVQDTIFPSEINNGSSDNCMIASMEVNPNLITCDLIGTVIDVILTVTDDSGNQDFCTTQIAVEAEDPIPTVQNNCGSDTLFLFANPPATPGGNNAYQCEWNGPDGFVSFECNPVILEADEDNSGFYTVTITGITGCTAQGTVQTTVNDLPLLQPEINADMTEVCEGQIIELSTAEVPGSGVTYNWYFGSPPNGFLLSATQNNTYNWAGTFAGNFNFYVETERGSCTSEASNVLTVMVVDRPIAQLSTNSTTICEGETLSFPVVNSNANTTCIWTGPAGFESTSCSPAPIIDIMLSNAGSYTLIISEDGCESDPVTFSVAVLERPDTPAMFSNTFENNPLCEGETLLLNASSIPGAVSYEWESPTLVTFTSNNNSLSVPVATLAQHGGNWRVRAVGNPCLSEWSENHFVYISVRPESVTASVAPNPACEGEKVTFSASSGTTNVSYEWFYPNGVTTVAGQSFEIDPVGLMDAGTYTVVVTNEFGCSNTETVTLEVDDRPNITGVANNAPNCVLGPVDVQLTATIFPPNDGTYTYLWEGPGFVSTDSIATIPQLTESGSYTLTVTNGDGCISQTATTTVIIPPVVPTPAAPQADSPGPYCEGELLVFMTTLGTGNNVTYIWETPQGTITTANNQLIIDELVVTNTGPYSVTIESDGCESASSATTVIQVNPKPVAIPTSNSPVCEGETLELSVDCMTGVTYEWQGPNGFSSSLCNPIIPNATSSLMDEPFRVRVNVDGCWSDEVQISVNIKSKPTLPTAVNFGPYCSSEQDVTVGVSSGSATPGATYTWFVEGTDTPLGQTSGLIFTVPDAAQYGDGTVSFVVIADLDGCESELSSATTVELNTIPTNEAEAGAPIVVCDGEIITLEGTAPTVGTGIWTLVEGDPTNISIANPDQATTTAAGFTPGVPYLFQWTLSNGVCEDYSFDTTSVFVNIVEFADAGSSFDVCNETAVQLNAIMPTSNVGMWSQPPGQEVIGVTIVDPADPNTMITNLIPGQSFLFTWTIEGGCGTDAETISVTVSNETAFAGSDMESCSIDGCIQMSAAAASGGGVWSTTDPNLEIISPNDPNTIVCGFTPGQYTLTWFINDGACGEASIDDVVIDFKVGPIANDDQIGIGFAQETDLQLLLNDQVPENFTINLLDEPVGGTVELDQTTGIITYDADISFIGAETITYELCAENCDCSTAVITIQVGLDATCTAPNIFTPNQDGINDFFVIPCLADGVKYPRSEISIFNSWGDEVFGASPYQNNWEGFFDGEELPAGTYFYVLNLGTGEKPMSGFITLQR